MLSSAVHTLAAGPSIDTTSMLPASNADVICIMVGFWTATPRFSWLGIREYSTHLGPHYLAVTFADNLGPHSVAVDLAH